MKNISLKKLASLFLALALVFTCVVVPTNTVQAAKTKAIKVTNIKGSTKSLKEGTCFTLKTNYKASKLNFTVAHSERGFIYVTSKGTIVGRGIGTSQVTISLKKNPKIKKTITVNVSNNKKTKYLDKKDFDISGFYDGGFEYKGKIYSNYIDYFNAGGEDCCLVAYIQENEIFTSDGDWKTFKTNRGIKMGDSLTKVMKAYKNTKCEFMKSDNKHMDTKNHKAKHYLAYTTKNSFKILFYFDQNDKVMCISYGY